MNIGWRGIRCILCLKEDQLSIEHLIPKSLGGRLTCRLLCRSCNSKLGSELEASAKSDRDILDLAMRFQDLIPQLKELVESHPHVGHSTRGTVEGLIKNDDFRIVPKTLEDGSIILPPDRTPQAVRAMLQRQGSSRLEIERALERISRLEEDEEDEVEAAPGVFVKNWPIQEIKPDTSKTGTISPLLPAIIAFEFLALHVGDAICGDESGLSEMRDIFRNRDEDSRALKVERLHAQVAYPSPFHGIALEEKTPYAKVQIRLFAKLAFRVHFRHIGLDAPSFQYTHELESGKEFVRDLESGEDYLGSSS